MPELVINVPKYIGESYMDWETCEWVQGITWADIEMQLWWAEALGDAADSICLSFGACDGGSTLEGFLIYNNLRALGLPIRTVITGYAASMAVPLSLVGDELPEMEYTAQLMFHAASFAGGTWAETSKDLRAKADQLDNTNELLLDLMVNRTGQTPEVVTQWMSADTWFKADEALAVGLCGKVRPLRATTTAKAAASLITARRRQLTPSVARVSRHAQAVRKAPIPKAKSAATAAKTPRPMPKKLIPITQAVAKKAAAPSAKQKANIAAVKAFADSMGVKITAEGDAPEAVAEATVLADGAGTLYTDGPLAQGSAVFNDQEMTEATDDATYEAEDGREIVVAGGTVESVSDASAEEEGEDPAAGTAALTAAITAALAPITTRLDAMEGKVTAFGKVVPPTPRPTGKAGAPQTDPKNSNKPKPKAAHHGTM